MEEAYAVRSDEACGPWPVESRWRGWRAEYPSEALREARGPWSQDGEDGEQSIPVSQSIAVRH